MGSGVVAVAYADLDARVPRIDLIAIAAQAGARGVLLDTADKSGPGLLQVATAPELERTYKHRLTHDPRDLDRARQLATPGERLRLGVFYRNARSARYDLIRRVPPRAVRNCHRPRHG